MRKRSIDMTDTPLGGGLQCSNWWYVYECDKLRPGLTQPVGGAMKHIAAIVFGTIISTCPLTTAAKAAESQYLKGVTAVTYDSYIGPNEKPCVIDSKAWSTSIDFVANQSTKLKFLQEAEHTNQAKVLYDKVKWPTSDNDEEFRKWSDALEKANRFNSMPRLSFSLTTMDVINGCVATIEAKVTAALEASKMISTGTSVLYPTVEIWSEFRLVKAPFQTFSTYGIQVSEEVLKKFVNQWAGSQEHFLSEEELAGQGKAAR